MTLPSFTLEGRRMLITGAASGSGRALARMAAADNAHVALLDKNESGLEETMQSLEGDGSHCSVAVDLSDWPSVESAVAQSREFLTGFDAVCNVAGWNYPGRFWEQPYDFWQTVIGVNLWSTLHVIRATVNDLREQHSGTIVNVSSDAGRVGSKGETVYAAAKGGVIALTKSLARELATGGVTVNCVCPGPTMTPLLETEIREHPRLTEKLIAAIPMRRVAEPEDQASAIAFLASPAASYITGQVLSVNGGLTMVG
jgi:2-hydroxycyclohexanecarboxyl-CoA dehydrogenase